MDISTDGQLLVTGSADKNIRIWGLEFGDCHKSLFAHGDSVMAVAFAPGTHYVFSAGREGGGGLGEVGVVGRGGWGGGWSAWGGGSMDGWCALVIVHDCGDCS